MHKTIHKKKKLTSGHHILRFEMHSLINLINLKESNITSLKIE